MLNRLLIASAMLVLLSMHPLQAQQPGALTFASNCAACHGADGRGGEHAPNIATAPEVQHLADTDLAGIIRNGISGQACLLSLHGSNRRWTKSSAI